MIPEAQVVETTYYMVDIWQIAGLIVLSGFVAIACERLGRWYRANYGRTSE